jgi:hypothetical protein
MRYPETLLLKRDHILLKNINDVVLTVRDHYSDRSTRATSTSPKVTTTIRSRAAIVVNLTVNCKLTVCCELTVRPQNVTVSGFPLKFEQSTTIRLPIPISKPLGQNNNR